MQPEAGSPAAERTFVEAARRRQLVVAAIGTIAEEGYGAATFVRIADRASVSPGLITYHFRTKDELIKELLIFIHTRIDTSMAGGPDPTSSYLDGLSRMVVGYVRHCSRHPEEMITLREVSTASSSAAVRAVIMGREQSGMGELVAFLTEGQQQRQFRSFDVTVFAATLRAALQAVPRQLQGLPPEQQETYAEELALLFVHAAAPAERRRPAR